MTRHYENERTTNRVAILAVVLLAGLLTVAWLNIPEQPPVQDFQTAGLHGNFSTTVFPTVQQDSTDGASTKERYEKALSDCRQLAKECRLVSVKFFDSSLADSYEWKEKWPDAAKALADQRVVLEKAALDWFFECEKPSEDMLQLASAISAQVYEQGDMELCWRILNKVKQFYSNPDDISLNQRIAMVGIRTNRYQVAKDFLEMPGAKKSVEALESNLDKNLFVISSRALRNWKEEQEIRKKEAEADDLPRVKFQLSTGEEVIFELFENEAPETVANFISLVESEFYDETFFHPVIKGLVAQTGMYNKSHSSDTGYVIKNESRVPNARKHFVGSLSLASKKDGEASGSAAFAITLVPNPELDWDGDPDDEVSQPVFGRVLVGLEHIAALPVTVEIDAETEEQKVVKDLNPALIEKATVIRKRDHEYTFTRNPTQGGKDGK